jgi:hypothetical protein
MLWLLYLQGNRPGTHWIGGWVDPRAILDAVVKRKIPSIFNFIHKKKR